MGLREMKAARTHDTILRAALRLFETQGYDATTMEEIAAAAEVGTSTLYRYFPTKEMLLVTPLSLRGHLVAEFRRRPAEEPLEQALGHAIEALMTAPRAEMAERRAIFEILAVAPAAKMRLHDEVRQERTELEEAVAERLGRPHGDIFSVVTARLAIAILETVGDHAPDVHDDPAQAQKAARAAMHAISAALQAEAPAVPSFDL
ncbi:helix-turn-helix domain containing protein [Nocardioides sp. BP30]|uniref:TetR/AcrR family transcriptional regulator n=1 Tax=Nocardioides sp. BP30 TaxID=3036374 RepID=UPI0024695FED|nr:helix-turn-helix domain-containing protein [Nocardioides sp. BP30]WGL52984.1 helix-turn-helix domain containing protein [Nocardioides sp. BP30]